MTLSTSAWRNVRDDLSQFPHSYIGEFRGLLNYLAETLASFSEEAVELDLPNDGIRIPNFYSDETICLVIHKLFEFANHPEPIVMVNPSNNGYKLVQY